MKKIILLISFTSLLFNCSNGGNASSSNNNSNGNSFTNSMDYEFTITINGEIHKVKGNTTNGIPTGNINSSFHQVNNTCYIGTGGSLYLKINDVTAPNYISGQNITCNISLPNLLLGINQATVQFYGGYINSLASSLGASPNAFILFQTTPSSTTTNYGKLPITITDLGTTSTNPTNPGVGSYSFGETLKGNYNGTIYLPKNAGGDIPVQLSIDFKALRMY